MNIFVGNLLFEATQGDVKKLFEGFGNVASVVITMEKEKKAPKSRGFGFVQMPDEQQALAAIAALNGKEFMGRVLNVNPARPKAEAHRKSELRKKMQPKFAAGAEQYSRFLTNTLPFPTIMLETSRDPARDYWMGGKRMGKCALLGGRGHTRAAGARVAI